MQSIGALHGAAGWAALPEDLIAQLAPLLPVHER